MARVRVYTPAAKARARELERARRAAKLAADPQAYHEKQHTQAKRWRRNNPEKYKAQTRRYYVKHRAARLAYEKERSKLPHRMQMNKAASLRHHYGASVSTFDRLLAAQGGVCAICLLPPAQTSRTSMSLHVDHCHATKEIRGLLCHSCNAGLGRFKDDAARLERAACYLRAAL